MRFFPFWKRRQVTDTQPGNGLLGAVQGEILHAGADLYAPAHKATDPAIMVTGTGYIPAHQWAIVQPPPLRAVMVAGVSGLGGAQAGSWRFSPLVDPDTLNPSE